MEIDPVRSSRRTGTLKAVLVLTLVVITVAIGLMAWNQHQASDSDALRLLQRDALLAGERLDRNADSAERLLEQELRAGMRVSEIDAGQVGVDQLIGLNAALQSKDESIAELADTASVALREGHTLTLLPDGRFMLLHVPTVGDAIIATVAAKNWMPAVGAGKRVVLYGPATASFGDQSVLPPSRDILNRGHGFRYQNVIKRSATACVGMGRADFSLCASQDSPLLTAQNGIELLLYFLLLAAPSLAVYGLYSQIGGGTQARLDAPQASPSSAMTAFETAAANAAVGYWEVRTGDGSVEVNSETARLLGLNLPGELPETEFYDTVYNAHRKTLRDSIDQARPSHPFTIQFATAMSGGENWLEMRGSQVFAGDRAVISGILFDVTESVRLRERQRSAEAKLRSAIENFPCPFALWDSKKRLSFWNRSFEQAFDLENVLRPGVSHETVMLARSGSIVSERTSPDDTGMVLLGLRSGDWLKLVERSTPVGGLISFGLDVTQDVQNEETLMRQQKKLKTLVQELERSEGHNAELARKLNDEKSKAERSADSKSAFLANMSHELRTPLNAINGFSEILVNEMYGPLGDKRYGEYARDILTSGQHLLDMINDILDIAKIEAGKMTIDPKPIDLVDPVDAAVRMIRRKAEDKGVQLTLQSEDGLPEVDADHRAVRQMVLNLLSNAIKFTDAGGRIMVAVQRKEGFLRVAVRDTGVGIPKEHLPRLAQPFEQVQETRERNYDGTGLGLALTKSFAEMHGGRFTIASELGRGTMVSFYLPVSTDLSRSDRHVA